MATTERKCACVSDDARECIRRRYQRPYDPDHRGEDDERCECACHHEMDDSDPFSSKWDEDYYGPGRPA